VNTSYTFTLVVNDGSVNSPADQIVITVKKLNIAPVAKAGADQIVNEGASTTLDGLASTEVDRNPFLHSNLLPT
jgi:hypothetical protein